MNIKQKINNLFQNEFPKEIKEVYVYLEFYDKEESKYCVDLWKGVKWEIGEIIPMFKKKNKIAFYKLTKAYYSQGTSAMSDWAWGDDGKNRDFKFHHIKK